MSKKNQTIITISAAIIVVVAALLVGPIINNALSNDDNGHGGMDMSADSNSGSYVQKESSEYKKYAALTGDAYDSAFISNMIVHHEGAVAMAEAALKSAGREEIKDMANAIIAAQTSEIEDMKQWQKQWGYADMEMDHAAAHGDMEAHMEDMEGMLAGKTGDEFDKAFLEQMIVHHQGALNMAAPGEKNAKHQEVKALTKAVVEAQTAEIKQMKEWQSAWGF